MGIVKRDEVVREAGLAELWHGDYTGAIYMRRVDHTCCPGWNSETDGSISNTYGREEGMRKERAKENQ